MSLMASPSSFPSQNYNFNVFVSFHGPDVRKTLLSHIRKQFNRNGITMFDDQKIERSARIAPSLTIAIRESMISIVILSKKYASSSWCLDELVEILECKNTMGQIVMTVFYDVEPSDVRKHTGKFGIAFDETCACKTDEERQKWSKALNEVGNIAGEDFLKWDNEANMIEKIAREVSDKLNATPSRDFDGMVGIKAHLREMESLLDLDYAGVKMVAITGPAGIGKTTIARALQSKFSNRFQLTCFMDNLSESYPIGLDEYGLKLRLQEQFLSNLLNQNGMRIFHLGVIENRLRKQRVLIILDDVNNITQLEALANNTLWFGAGSRIVVTTENKGLLQQHGIDNIYHVGFPSNEEAVKILYRYAFRHRSPCHGFETLAYRATRLCGKLPLGLRVVGSTLRGKKEGEWENVMNGLEAILDRDIKDVLRVGYKSLDENEKILFLHIAVFFNNRDVDLVTSMFADSNFDVKYKLNILESKSLIEISTNRERIVMHRLLQQVSRNIIHKQKPWKCRILIDAHEIYDVLEDTQGTSKVVGVSFDISGIDEVSMSKETFKRMPFLRFLKVYKSKHDGNESMHIPEGIEFPCHLKLLHWEEYPRKSLPCTINVEHLVEINMHNSQLEYLWRGAQPLNNLKHMDLTRSKKLKELPNLSNAKNLEKLYLSSCESLIEIPSSCSNLHKLTTLWVNGCKNLKVIPADMNLACLEWVFMRGCSRLRNIPVMSTSIKQLYITNTSVENVPPSIRLCSHLEYLDIRGSRKFKGLTHLPTSVKFLQLNNTDIERIPDFIKDLHGLHTLTLCGCRSLASLPELPDSLLFLYADDCESLETVYCPFNSVINRLNFTNCFKLGKQARRGIIQQSIIQQSPGFLRKTLLPGLNVPGEFDHRAKGNILTIRPGNGNHPYTGLVFCVVISPRQKVTERGSHLSWRRIIARNDGYPVEGFVPVGKVFKFRTEHMFIFHSSSMCFYKDSSEIVLEFSSKSHDFDIIQCGAMIFNEESIKALYESGLFQVDEDGDIELEPSEESSEYNTEYIDPTNGVICDSKEYEKRRNCWSWFFLCFCLFLLLGSLTNYGLIGKLGFRG